MEYLPLPEKIANAQSTRIAKRVGHRIPPHARPVHLKPRFCIEADMRRPNFIPERKEWIEYPIMICPGSKPTRGLGKTSLNRLLKIAHRHLPSSCSMMLGKP